MRVFKFKSFGVYVFSVRSVFYRGDIEKRPFPGVFFRAFGS